MEDIKNIMSAAAEALVDKPLGELDIVIKEPSTIEKLKLKITGGKKPIRKFVIERTVLRNCYRIASRAVLIDENIFQADIEKAIFEAGFQHYPDLVYIIAAGLQNNSKEPEQELIDFIWDNFTNEQMLYAFDKILSQYNIKDFMQSIILIKGADILTKREDQKSENLDRMSPMDQAETIAPGVPGV